MRAAFGLRGIFIREWNYIIFLRKVSLEACEISHLEASIASDLKPHT